jgi:penicillin amidase
MREAVLAAPAREADARQALDLLGGWDGVVSAESPAAAVHELFLSEMAQRVVRAKAPRSFAWALGRGATPLQPASFFAFRRAAHLVRLLREQPPDWFARPWPEEVADVLASAVRRLRRQFGPDPAAWAWGRIRPLTFLHPLGRSRALGRVFNLGPVPFGGDTNTIAQGSVDPLAPLSQADNTPSLRAVFDVGAWDGDRFALPGGQSGNPLSPHYADQLPLWQRGEGIPIPWSDEAVREATREMLELLPAGEGVTG